MIGFSGQMPEPTWICSVCASEYGMNDSLADRWEYSVRQWCSRHPHVLPVVLVGDPDHLELVHRLSMLGDGVVSVGAHEHLHEDPELHCVPPVSVCWLGILTRALGQGGWAAESSPAGGGPFP